MLHAQEVRYPIMECSVMPSRRNAMPAYCPQMTHFFRLIDVACTLVCSELDLSRPPSP